MGYYVAQETLYVIFLQSQWDKKLIQLSRCTELGENHLFLIPCFARGKNVHGVLFWCEKKDIEVSGLRGVESHGGGEGALK